MSQAPRDQRDLPAGTSRLGVNGGICGSVLAPVPASSSQARAFLAALPKRVLVSVDSPKLAPLLYFLFQIPFSRGWGSVRAVLWMSSSSSDFNFRIYLMFKTSDVTTGFVCKRTYRGRD